MPSKDKRVDAFIAKSADFAKPILTHLRALIHRACPLVEETMKWGFPHFTHHGLLCALPAFKAHCHLGFWKGELVFGTEKKARESLQKITTLADLPADEVLIGYVKKAAALNEAGIKPPAPKRKSGPNDLTVPEFFMTALRTNKKALATFQAFSYTHKKEYVEWVTGAKREETRRQRIETALEWLAEGKSRNWKYENRC